MLYNELIEEVTKRVKTVSTNSEYVWSFSEKLSVWLEDFEHDIMISLGNDESVTVEFLADASFDKKIDEEFGSIDSYKSNCVD